MGRAEWVQLLSDNELKKYFNLTQDFEHNGFIPNDMTSLHISNVLLLSVLISGKKRLSDGQRKVIKWWVIFMIKMDFLITIIH